MHQQYAHRLLLAFRAPRAADQLAAAVRAPLCQTDGTGRAEGALVAADEGEILVAHGRLAPLARGPHLERHATLLGPDRGANVAAGIEVVFRAEIAATQMLAHDRVSQ